MKEILLILLEIAYKTVLFGIIVIVLTGGAGIISEIINEIVDSVSVLMRITIDGIDTIINVFNKSP